MNVDTNHHALSEIHILAQKTYQVFQEPIYVVGTVSQLLNGINVEPRDIDILLPESVSLQDFIDDVFTPLGYKDLGDFCWNKPQLEGAIRTLDVSHPNLMHEKNIFAAAPELSYGWKFSESLWNKFNISSGLSVNIPAPELSLLLKIKSISDKIFLSTQSQAKDAIFWKKLLVNDIRCLEAELNVNKDKYSFEDTWSAISFFPRNKTARDQLFKAISFSFDALTGVSNKYAYILRYIESALRLYFLEIEPSKNEQYGNIGPFNENGYYSDVQTGAIYRETNEGSLSEETLPEFPFLADIQLNSSCNMKCAHCDYIMTEEVMPLEILKDRLIELKEMGVLQVNFGEGSEALMYPHLAKALNFTHEIGMIPNLSTNLSIEPPKEVWHAMEKLCGAVAVSLDRFHSPRILDKSGYSNVFARIKRLTQSGVFVVINTVYDKNDVKDCAEIINIAESLNCSTVCLIRRFYKDASYYNKISLADFNRLCEYVFAAKTKGVTIGFHSCDPISKVFSNQRDQLNSSCLTSLTEARHSVFLDSQGKFRPSSFSEKNAKKYMPLKDAWTNLEFKNFRKDTEQGMLFIE